MGASSQKDYQKNSQKIMLDREGGSDCLFSIVREKVIACLRHSFPDIPDDIFYRVEVTLPKDSSHGDMATNAALTVAKIVKQNPRFIAQKILDYLEPLEGIEKVEIAGPGFVNVTLSDDVWHSVVGRVLSHDASHFGSSLLGAGKKVNVEYVSANPTGPMHVGHCRGAVVGDCVANLLEKIGYHVDREYYINDAGNQVTALTWAAYWRYLQAVSIHIDADAFSSIAPTGLQYQGDYLIDVGKKIAEKYGYAFVSDDKKPVSSDIWFDKIRELTLSEMMKQVRQDLSDLGIKHEIFSSEKKILEEGDVEKAIQQLNQKGLLYRGVLPPPKGKTPQTWESRPQLLFRSTDFGDDVDRALQKADGSNTYFANDIGYHDNKAQRSDILIDVWGADHGGYVSRMRAAIAALTDNKTLFDVLLCQIVRIVKNGQPVRMSKRAGTFVTLRELLDDVGRDAVRFTMLTRRADAQMEFDLDVVVSQTKDNPVFYVNYAHARCCSVLRHAEEKYGEEKIASNSLVHTDLSSLTSPEELNVLKRIASFPSVVKGAAKTYEPHRIVNFCIDLASDFHFLWNKGKEDAELRFINNDVNTSLARLALIATTVKALRSGLMLLGVEPLSEMR